MADLRLSAVDRVSFAASSVATDAGADTKYGLLVSNPRSWPAPEAVDRVRPSSVATDGRGHQGAYQRPKQKGSSRERLVAAVAPGRDPESCEVDYVVDAQGTMVAVLVRDVLNGEVIARINAEDLWQLGSEEAAGGILLERKG